MADARPPLVSDALEIERAELRWAAHSLAEELAALHAEQVKRENERDQLVAKLRVTHANRGAVQVRFRDAMARHAPNPSHTP